MNGIANFHVHQCARKECGITWACSDPPASCKKLYCFRCDPEEQQAKMEREADRREDR
jgi:hypothetical protein